jgi:hypothetical protein
MAKCPICGMRLVWIELDDSGRVADDCERCTPRGYELPDEEFRDEVIGEGDYDNG